MSGLCDCLKLLSDHNCRHGDLKPQNILHKGRRENFLIADVGLSRVHNEATNQRRESSTTRSGTYRYEGPEVYYNADDDRKPLSRDYDIWSMGIVLLDWLVWLISGKAGLSESEAFHVFWEKSDDGEYRVASNVRKFMEKTEQKLDHNTALKDIFMLVKERLLVTKLAGDKKTEGEYRAKAKELSESMAQISKKASEDAAYASDKALWPRRKNTQVVTQAAGPTLELPERRYLINKLPTPTSPVSGDEDTYEVSNGSGPKIIVDYAESTSAQQTLPPRPDEYSDASTHHTCLDSSH